MMIDRRKRMSGLKRFGPLLLSLLAVFFTASASAQNLDELRATIDTIEEYATTLRSEVQLELEAAAAAAAADVERTLELRRREAAAVRLELVVRRAKAQLERLEEELEEKARIDTYGAVVDVIESPLSFQDRLCASAGESAINGKRYINGKCR
jgi:AMMECR1 domain-containing protein